MTAWEINCQMCGRSSWDGKPDDVDGDRCPVCGQLPGGERDQIATTLSSLPNDARLDRVEELLRDAITTLANMRVDCTRSMREDELSDIENRRVTALGYLRDAWTEAGLAADAEWWARAFPTARDRRLIARGE